MATTRSGSRPSISQGVLCSLLLSPCAIFSKSMKSNEIDILGALTGLLKKLKETNQLASKPLDQWPTYAAIIEQKTTNIIIIVHSVWD